MVLLGTGGEEKVWQVNRGGVVSKPSETSHDVLMYESMHDYELLGSGLLPK